MVQIQLEEMQHLLWPSTEVVMVERGLVQQHWAIVPSTHLLQFAVDWFRPIGWKER